MEFEWDETKNKTNTEKHKLSFEEASKVFDDENAIDEKDLKHSVNESRRFIIGAIFRGIVFVIYTIRNGFFRIISARPAKDKERNDYYDNTLKKK